MNFKNTKRIDSCDDNVAKFVFSNDKAVAEAVLYKYPDYKTRTVICCSTMSGCPVGCRFCGAGDYFVKNLSSSEIVEQVDHCISETGEDASGMERLQIMFMSMGEPMLNFKALEDAIRVLYSRYPKAALLISTIGPDVDYLPLIELSKEVPTVGLQFSVHQPTDERRNKLIPFDKKLSLRDINAIGTLWSSQTGRKPFFNYCAGDDNSTQEDANKIAELFSPVVWNATVSVICERNEGMLSRNNHQMSLADKFSSKLVEKGFDVRVFDPAGQDDIGGGCGQLWFVQDWMRNNPSKAKPSIGNGLPKVHVPAALKE